MKKLILSLVLIFLIPTSFTRIYSYQQDVNTPHINADNTHVLISQIMETAEGNTLVPTGAILGVGDVEEVTFTYVIFIQDGVDFNCDVDNLNINDQIVSADIENLFNFDVNFEKLEDDTLQLDLFDTGQEGYYIEVTVVLSMNFPSQEQYIQISGQQLSFEVSFESAESKVV
jgi:hypothetical protein